MDRKNDIGYTEFDYAKAVEELENIVLKVEDARTGLDDIDRYLERSKVLVAQCRTYLRSAREKCDEFE